MRRINSMLMLLDMSSTQDCFFLGGRIDLALLSCLILGALLLASIICLLSLSFGTVQGLM